MKKLENKPRPRSLYLVLAVFVLLVASRLLDPKLSRGDALLDSALLQIVILIIPTFVYMKLINEKKLPTLHLTHPRVEVFPAIFSATLAVICQSLLIGIVFGNLKAFSGSFTLYDTLISESGNGGIGKILLFVAYAILPALAEELIFRSIMCAECEKYGIACGVITSSFFFAMIHFDIAKFPIYFFAGVILALVRYATRSAISAVIVHVLYNAFAIAFQSQIYAFYNNAGGPDLFVFLLTLSYLISIAAFFAFSSSLYRKYAKRNYFSEHNDEIPLKKSLSNFWRILICAPSLACIVIYALTLIVSAIAG